MTDSNTDDLASAERRIQALARELVASRQQQAATSEILRVISGSPTDLERVFAEIAMSAARLCDAYDAHIFQVDDNVLRNTAHHGPIPAPNTLPLSRGLLVGRSVLDQRTIHIADMQAQGKEYPEGSDVARRLGFRTNLAVPLIRACKAIGVISIRRTEVRPFTDQQVELLKTFADQVVIAIENTRLFEEVQARSAELRVALEQQTATSELLKVIGRSTFNLHPVFETLAENAVKLCEAEHAFVFRFDGHFLHCVATHNIPPALKSFVEANPIQPGRGSGAARAALERRTVQIEDMRTDPEFTYGAAQVGPMRTLLAVPMLRADELLGVILITRPEIRLFSNNHIALMETFANQAVIAIENTRLFEAEQTSKRELQESLEYQTATSEVLGVISRSPTELRQVLDTIARTSQRLCEADRSSVWRLVDRAFELAAISDHSPAVADYMARAPIPADRTSVAGRCVFEKRTLHVHDRLNEPGLPPLSQSYASDTRTLLCVPLLRKGEPIGVVRLSRDKVAPFAPRQIALVETFADQAVIAIENARLFEEVQARTHELQESLEFQTATIDILNVISRSQSKLQPVLDVIVNTATRLCQADYAFIWKLEGNLFQLAAMNGTDTSFAEFAKANLPVLDRSTSAGRCVLEKRPIHIPDVFADPEYRWHGDEGQRIGNYRSLLGVPLMREDVPFGAFALLRREARPFSDKEIELVASFADQAAIAIENTRLFEEVQARTSELAKTVEDLEIASQHKNQFVANMSHELRTPLAAILGYAELIQEGFYEPQGPKSLDALTRIRSNGKHLLGLINTVLDIAKIESGQFTLNMTEYAIESVVETVRAATESLAQNKKLTLTTSVDKSLPVGLGDEQRLTQVLLNLVGNAIKFTDAGAVSIAAGARNGHFTVSVTDTGPGIPLDQQDRIFEQFHQVDSSMTKAKGGTGLGLAIAKQIVEMHGGRIWVVSTPGKGSTFQMELPTRAQFHKMP